MDVPIRTLIDGVRKICEITINNSCNTAQPPVQPSHKKSGQPISLRAQDFHSEPFRDEGALAMMSGVQ
jgi:hypothetical protein